MSLYKYINTINNSGKKLFLTKDLHNLFRVNSERTLEDIIRRMIDEKIFTSLERGKYMLAMSQVSDFEIAQFLYSPSYISFETALNYHGILSQFPIEITSATTKSTERKEVLEKSYSYSKISTRLFVGYSKEGDSLIALPEKALFDQLYMIAKGIKTTEYLDEMDYTHINKNILGTYLDLSSVKLAGTIRNLINSYL